MAKKAEIPTNCLCDWEKRTVYVRSSNGGRTEEEQAELTKLEPKCTVHKGIRDK